MMPLLSEHSNNISLNEDLFKRIKAVYDERNTLELTDEERRLLEKLTMGLSAMVLTCRKKIKQHSEKSARN